MRIACIGSRSLGTEDLSTCFSLGRYIASYGGEIHSGNAEGADRAFANGGSSADPKLVNLHLPWPGFNEDAILEGNVVHVPPYPVRCLELAREHHPRWDYLSQGAQKLHTRNASIVLPLNQPVQSVLAFPSQKAGGGGTGQGIRIAEGLGIEVIDLNGMIREELFQLCERLRATNADL